MNNPPSPPTDHPSTEDAELARDDPIGAGDADGAGGDGAGGDGENAAAERADGGAAEHAHDIAHASVKPGPGSCLRDARERQGRSQTEVAALLRLPKESYAALEDERYEQLKGPVYVRGYFRIAAKELQLSSDALVAAYDLQFAAAQALAGPPGHYAPITTQPSAAAARHRGGALLAASVAAALVAALAWWWQSERVPESVSTNGAGVDSPTGVAGDDGAGVAGGAVSYALGAADSAPELTAKNGDLDQLSIRFSGESWVQVKDAQQRLIYEGWHRLGDHPQLSGRAPFQLVIGNVKAVSITMNGAAVKLATGSHQADGSAVLIVGDSNASDLTPP